MKKTRIVIGKNLITCKNHGWNLSVMADVEIVVDKKKTGEFKQVEQWIGFYSEIDQLANRLLQGQMIQGDMKSVQDFVDCIESFKQALKDAL